MTALQQIIYIITIKNYLQFKAKVYRKKISQKNRDGNKKNLDNSSQCHYENERYHVQWNPLESN